MPPYWDNKALHTPTRYFIFNFLIISIFIENKCLSMRYEIWKGRKKVQQKAGSNSGRLRQKAHTLPSTPLKLMLNKRLFSVLSSPITRWWAELL